MTNTSNYDISKQKTRLRDIFLKKIKKKKKKGGREEEFFFIFIFFFFPVRSLELALRSSVLLHNSWLSKERKC